MRRSIPNFTKEKAVFLVAALICAGVAYRFVASQPLELRSEAPSGGGNANPLEAPAARANSADESAYFTGKRRSPFGPPQVTICPPSKNENAALPVPPPQVENTNVANTAKPEFTGTRPDELYSFSGVIVWKGTHHALLAGKKGSSTLRAREGDRIAGGFRITRIEKQSIELKHESGHVFVLKDKGA